MQEAERIDPVAVGERSGLQAKVELLLESERWPRERLEAHQRRLLGRLLDCARSTPFWSQRLPATGPERIEQLPLLRRIEIQERAGEMLVPGEEPLLESFTSGTSGRAIRVLQGPELIGFEAASRLRHQHRWGIAPEPQPEAGFEVRGTPEAPPVRRIARRPAKFLLSPYRVDASTLPEVHEALTAAGGVRLIGAWPSMVEPWARLYEESELDPRELGVELAVLGAEQVADSQRCTIGEVFGCEVGEVYGMREMPAIACECDESSLHINEERFILEVVGADGEPLSPGEPGEIVVTLLHSFEMPLIRYRTGDVGRLAAGSCRCGRTLRSLELDVGRLEDTVLGADGRLWHARCVRQSYESILGPALLAHDTEQLGPGRFRARLELRGAPPAELASTVGERLGAFLREPVEVELELGPVAPTEPGRKLRTFRRWAGPDHGPGPR